ncbi:MAG: DUF2155 domain-containing protein [Alphaproteobacteria bacterium]|nr:DUF2155 domain-containing protein [Alphaproteobacteria bacterium]
MRLCFFLLVVFLILAAPAWADLIPHRTATLRILDKMTARVEQQDVALDTPVLFGKIQLTLRACRQAPAEDSPQSAAFFDISNFEPGHQGTPIFRGWMFAASTAISAMEHPIYDVWLMGCKNPLQTPQPTDNTEADNEAPAPAVDAVTDKTNQDTAE